METINGYKLSPLQKQLWAAQNTQGVFNTCVSCAINATIELDVIKKVVAEIQDDHEILKTSYPTHQTSEYPVQSFDEKGEVISSYKDISELSPDDQLKLIATIKEERLNTNHDLTNGSSITLDFFETSNEVNFLLISIPTINCDSISLVNFVKLLDLKLIGTESESETIQYTQFSEWLNEDEEVDTEGVYYWKNQFTNEGTVQLPFEIEGGQGTESTGEFCIPLEDTLIEDLREFSDEHGFDIQTIVISGWITSLWRYMDKPSEFSIGRSYNGRLFEEFDNMIGLFALNLPMKCQLQDSRSFLDVCHSVRSYMEESEMQSESYYDVIGKADHTSSKLDYGFQVNQYDHLDFENVKIKDISNSIQNAKLTLEALVICNQIKLKLNYSKCLFDKKSIEIVADNLKTIISHQLTNPTDEISELHEISDFQKIIITESFNTQTEKSAFVSPIDSFLKLSQQNPDKVAISYLGEDFKFEFINNQSDKLAEKLKKDFGIVKGDVVAVELPRSPRAIISMLAIMKANAAFLMIDSGVPDKRKAYMLKDSKAKLLIREFDQDEVIPVFVFDNDLKGQEVSDTSPSFSGSDRAYVIYTSGSTGTPKGIEVSHLALSNYCNWFNGKFNITINDRTLLFSSLAFDLGFSSLWSALTTGATLCLYEEEEFLNADKLFDRLIDQQISYVKLTPSHFSVIASHPDLSSRGKDLSVRLFILGGEKIRIEDIDKYKEINEVATFVNHYGPTETTIGTAAEVLQTKDWSTYKNRSIIGSPVWNNQIILLSEEEKMIPIGEIGEICVAGLGLAKYLSEELTGTKYIDGKEFGYDRLYKTGDLGRWLPQGKLEFIGRKDTQVKIRGYRIEPKEVERILGQHDKVTRSAVLVEGSTSEDRKLIGFFQSKIDLSEQVLKKYLEGFLPEFMIPSRLIQVNEFPLIGNGKIDQSALMQLKLNQEEMSAVQAPRTELEKHITEIWKKVLATENVGVTDRFFDIGGNSLKMVKVFRELNQTHPGAITMADLFKYNTVESICKYIENQTADSAGDSVENDAFEV
ncbi:MAG: amino acid adenylation domain-containing protein [Bacteroidota bacterium]